MESHKIVSQQEWIEARRQHLAKEKELTRLRDELSEQRRNLPWVRVDKEYVFEGPNGKESLKQLFAGKSQLVIQHFMFAPDWDAGCKSCSFWADNYNGIIVHLTQRDVGVSDTTTSTNPGSDVARRFHSQTASSSLVGFVRSSISLSTW